MSEKPISLITNFDHGQKAEKVDATEVCSLASRRLYDAACERFGNEQVKRALLDKTDPGETLSLFVAGPDVFNAIGREAAHKVGQAAIEFGIAPVFGAVREAQNRLGSNL